MLHYDGDVDLDVYQARHIYALRHCERVDNVNPFWHYGNPRFLKDNPPLSDRGVAQAKEVALRFFLIIY